jgi:hypothetical protein
LESQLCETSYKIAKVRLVAEQNLNLLKIYVEVNTNNKFYFGLYSKTCLKQNRKGPEHFSAKACFPFNQGTLHIKIKPGHARI